VLIPNLKGGRRIMRKRATTRRAGCLGIFIRCRNRGEVQFGRNIFGSQQAPSPQLTSKDAILFDQILDGLLLPLIQPADQRGKQYSERKHVHHGGRVYRIYRDWASRSRWAEL